MKRISYAGVLALWMVVGSGSVWVCWAYVSLVAVDAESRRDRADLRRASVADHAEIMKILKAIERKQGD